MIWQIVVAFVGRACRTRSLESASARRAVTTPRRFPALPTRPAVAEALPGLAVVVWYGIAAPAKLPTSIFARLHAVIFRSLDQPDIPERIVRGRLGTWGNSSEQFRHYMLADPVQWAKLVGERCEAGLRRRESGSKKRGGPSRLSGAGSR